MNLDLKAMKAAALAAEPGSWEVDHDAYDVPTGYVAISSPRHTALAEVVWQMDGDVGHDDDRAGSDVCRANATHIATANPAAVLALIERLERAEADLASERAANAALTEENDRLQRRLDAAEAELARLRSQGEAA